MEENGSSEAAAALALISRLFIHLTVEAMIPKEVALGMLADCEKVVSEQGRPGAQSLLRGIGNAIDQNVPDDQAPTE
jgi:hypothetical protein